MHLPPAAAWTAGASQWQRALLAALALLAACASAFFCLNQRWGVSSIVLLMVLAVCTAVAMAVLWRPARGQLRWDGAQWHWSDPEDHAVRQLVCVLDLQRCLLVRLDCQAGMRRWLWLESPAMHAGWLALRRAVVASPQAMTRVGPSSLPE